MSNPLLISINRAVYDNRQLQLYFARYLGTAAHPRGQLLSAYRNARRAMETALKGNQQQRIIAANEVLQGLSNNARGVILTAVTASVALGIESADVQISAYFDEGETAQIVRQRANVNQLATAPTAQLTQQLTAVAALIVAGAASSEIVGDGTRLGLLQPAPIQNELARWMRQGVSSGFNDWIFGDVGSRRPLPFMRQAVAGIDERTTDCCLKVHGQIVGIDEPFKLTGTPRYSTEQHDPPFHPYCRTSVALYLPDYDDGFTDMMRKASILERKARESDNYEAPHPINAFTRVRE